MKTQIVKPINNKTKYKKIYHISDIHIRNTEDHKIIYSHVFDNLYTYLESVKNNNSLIVVTGDILHNKDKLTATGEEICINFFEKLSSIMDTIIIPGNHDFNEKNNNILDSISIIIYKRDFKNMHYLKDSGIYRFNNILFGVSSLIDNKFINASDINEKGLKIALYHGPVHNSKNSKGFEFSEQSLTKFDGYDLTLLGDIHFYQYLNEDKTIAYASSLISQNFSETDKYHGVLVWNLIDKTSEYKIIHNDYQFSELVIKENNIFYHDEKVNINKLVLPTYSKLRITHTDCDQDFYNNIVNVIALKNPFVNIVHNKLISNNTIKDKDIKINPKNNSLENIIEDEIKNIPKEYYNDIKKILDIELKNSIHIIDNKLNWKLVSLKFSNMFTYGKDNTIDFTKLTFDEITGLFGPNSSGKSSLVDILLFSLFDDYSRNNQDKNKVLNGTLINTNENIFTCSVKFNIDNTLYEINKEGKRKKAKTQHTFDSFDFTKYEFGKIVNNKYISLNGVDRIETLSYIIKLIGTYNDFCISSICFQNNSKNKIDFLNMTPLERKTF
jgi:DNA repair exonuclease SbcCD nuclease subunit